MKYIETEVWEKVPETSNQVRYVRQRKLNEVYDEIKSHLESLGILPDDYFHYDDKHIEFPVAYRIACFAVYGGSEGIYLHIDAYVENNNSAVNLILGKTLDESEEAFDRMYKAACECAKILKAW